MDMFFMTVFGGEHNRKLFFLKIFSSNDVTRFSFTKPTNSNLNELYPKKNFILAQS